MSIVKKIRKNMLLTQAEFAKVLGISRNMVCLYECGKFNPSLNMIKKLISIAEEKGIDINVSEFLNNIK